MKNLTFLAAIAVVGLSSCSKNEVTDITSSGDNVDRIGISTGVGITKGADMVGSSLQANDIVLSYTDSKTTPNSGTLTFQYDKTEGEWSDNTDGTKWSALTLPVVFFSFCDETGNITFNNQGTPEGTATSKYKVTDTNPETHNDLLYMSEVVSSIPVGGKIYSTFRHALSKVDLVSMTGANQVNANFISLKNLSSEGDAHIVASSTASQVKWSNFAGLSSYDNINRLVALTDIANEKTLSNNFIISNDQMTASKTANMKLIPQTIEADYDNLQNAIKAHQVDESYATADYSEYKYIEVLYRMNGSQDERIVGYEDAANHPDHDKWTQETKDKYYGKPLYVKGAFVLSKELNLVPSSYYKLNLNFNTFGGLLMDDKYYDQNGDRTDIKLVSDIETGDPIIPSDDTVIGITVVVDDWTTESDTDMQ